MRPAPDQGGATLEAGPHAAGPATADQPLVHVVILNWRRWRDTTGCLESVFGSDYPRLRVIVCDNDSQDDSLDRLSEWAAAWPGAAEGAGVPPPTIVETGANLGFSGGCNVGIAHALEQGADYVFLLNNDARVGPGTVGRLVVAARESGAAVVGCRVREGRDGRDVFAGARWPRLLLGMKPPRADGGTAAYWPTDYATGCAVLIRRDLLERRLAELGHVFDPDLFMYWEDVDLGLYARSSGLGCVVARDALVVHGLAQSSGGAFNPRSYYYLTRNRIYVANRWLGPLGRCAFHLYYAPSRLLIQALGRGGWRRDVLRAVGSGLIDGYRGVTGKWKHH